MNEKLRILILEDEASDADIIKWELEKGKIQFESLVVETRTEFEIALGEFQPNIILSDHSLPAFNSLEALKLVRKMEVKIPFILTTGNVSEEYAVEVMRSGADDYILKDRLQRLPSAIKNVLEKYRLAHEKSIAEQRTRERDANLHAIINNTNDVLFSVDRSHHLLCFNKVYSDTVFAITGVRINEGDTFFIWESNDTILKEWGQYIKRGLDGEQFVTETSYVFKDKVFFYEIAINPIRKENEVIGVGCFSRDITERKNAQQQQALLSSIINSSDDAIISKTLDGIITSWNKGAQILFGYTEKETMGQHISLIIPADRVNEEGEIIQKIKNGGHVSHYETVRKRKDNSLIQVSLTVSPIIGKTGIITGASKITRDITNQKEAEEKLKNSEERFRALMENNYDGITLRDENFSIVYRNPAAITMLGYTEKESISRSLLATAHPDDMISINTALQAVMHNIGKPVPITFRTRHKDGHYIWMEGVMTNMLHDKSVKAIVSNFRDITEARMSDRALQKSEERYRQIVETAQEGIWTVDEQNITTFVNKKLFEILGYTPEEMLGKPAFDFMGDEANKLVTSYIERWIQGIRENYEFSYITKNGKKIWINVSANPILNYEGKYKGALAMVTDITHRKEMEKELEKTLYNFNMLISNINEGFFSIDVADNFKPLIISNTFAEMYGYPAADFYNNSNLWFEHIHEDDKKKTQENLRLLHNGQSNYHEHRIIRKDKSIMWVSGNVTPTLNADGILIRLDGVISDITERKTAEDKLKKSEAALSEAQRVAKYGNWNFDVISDDLTWSEELYNVFGTDKDVFIETHKSFLHLVDEEDRDFARQTSLHTQKTGQPFDINYHITTPQGEKRIIHELGYAECDKEGKVIRLYGTAQDITDRKKAETELLALNEQFRNLSAHLQTVREEERTNIAREVHDELGQQLTSLKMDIASLKIKYEKELPDIGSKTGSMIEMVNEAISTVRKIVIALRPGILDDLGLEAAIEWQAKDFEQRTGIPCVFTTSIDSDRKDFSPQVNITVFRIFQESLTNVMRHANATQVIATLEENNSTLMMEITDNGVGISDERKNNKTSFGLLGMKERAAMLHGELKVFKMPVQGTKVNLKIPL
ncbi:MAG: domain S-box protein [Bacteroidota bacterium]|nr:domain S-box protein [Bacteroidota bacterium]